MTRCSLDLEKVADGWNAMSADISAFGWREMFKNKGLNSQLSLVETAPTENNDQDEEEPQGPIPLPIQDSVAVSALKDLAK